MPRPRPKSDVNLPIKDANNLADIVRKKFDGNSRFYDPNEAGALLDFLFKQYESVESPRYKYEVDINEIRLEERDPESDPPVKIKPVDNTDGAQVAWDNSVPPMYNAYNEGGHQIRSREQDGNATYHIYIIHDNKKMLTNYIVILRWHNLSNVNQEARYEVTGTMPKFA